MMDEYAAEKKAQAEIEVQNGQRRRVGRPKLTETKDTVFPEKV